MPSNNASTDFIEDFLAKPPSWLLHSGTGLMCAISLIVLVMSWFIKYPDRIHATALISTQQAPVEIICPRGGLIDSILVYDQMSVRKGQFLGLLHNTAEWNDIKKVEQIVHQSFLTTSYKPLLDLSLGDIQTSFATWQQSRLELLQIQNQTITKELITAINQESTRNDQLSQALDQRIELYQQEVDLTKRDYERARNLNDRNVISNQDMETKKASWLQARRTMFNMGEEAIQNRIKTEQLKTEKLRLLAEYQYKLDESQRNFQQATLQLQAAIRQWKQDNLLTAPIDGFVFWQPRISKGQYFEVGKSPGTIIPSLDKNLLAVCTIPTMGSGRIAIGNKVQIELDAFPSDEFGYLEGVVQYIARLPSTKQDGSFFYQIEVNLPDTLVTSYGKIIPFRHNLSGTARIMTKERRVLERLFGKLAQLKEIK